MVTVISETKQVFQGKTYYLCGNYFQRKGKRLHREVWESLNGPIPKGFHVHHKDGDRSNNDISNLHLMKESEHLRLHGNTPEARAWAMKAIEIARDHAKEWHKTPEGRKMHSEWAREAAKKIKPTLFKCEVCGKSFYSKGKHSKFCSNNCKAANRRKSGVDNEIRTCEICGKEFGVNKYSHARSCSKKCAWKLRQS